MITKYKKTIIKCTIAVLSLTLLMGCSNDKNAVKNQASPATSSKNVTNPSTSSTNTTSSSVVYSNTQYGFNFTLPKSWKGFSIVTGIWEGNNVSLGKVTETGAKISIRHPEWTSKNPRQDIPIMVFTLAQWNLLQHGKISVSAAPIEPSELGRNNVYVFALPARYNFAFLTGYKEVEEIIANHPLKATNIAQSSDSKKAMLLNMMKLAKQGKVTNCDFAVKEATIDNIIKVWGPANNTVYVASAKGNYATYSYHNVVFGFNKGEQVFEVRSFDAALKDLSLAKIKEVFGSPSYDSKTKSEEIIGYKAGTEFKIEMVFKLPTNSNSIPVMDHYNVLYPAGTVNSMAGDSGRQW